MRLIRGGALALWLAVLLSLVAAPGNGERWSDENRIEKMMDKYRYEEYEALYFDVLSRTAGPGTEDFDTQPEPVKALYVVMILDMEIQNGGLAQFFWNEGAQIAALAPAALRETGLSDVAELYEGFLAENGITLEEIDSCRGKFPDFVGVYSAHPFEAFDQEYMRTWEETIINGRLLDYAARHPDVFGRE